MTPEATLAGGPANLDEAIAAAALLLGASRCAVVAGMDTDVAGAEAAIALARRIGAAVDHTHAAASLRDLEVMRASGWIVTTPLQVRARADLVLLVGLDTDPPALGLDAPPPLRPELLRRVLRVTKTDGNLLDLLGTVRARLAGRPVSALADAAAELIRILPEAHYGAVVWQAGGLDVLTLEMLCGLIDDLNAKTRFVGLPLPLPGNIAGVMQAAAWLTGFPLPLGFAGGKATHDPWRFDACRLLESGEADALLWVSAGVPKNPPWDRAVPTIALTASGTQSSSTPDIEIAVGRPGQDHDAVLFDPNLGTLAAQIAAVPKSAPRAADVLVRIAQKLAC